MTNPFENPEAEYLVLINEEKQHSLWPKFAEVPAGWTAVHQSDRASCIEYINRAIRGRSDHPAHLKRVRLECRAGAARGGDPLRSCSVTAATATTLPACTAACSTSPVD
ncbi:MAG: MbtH protein [Streptomyces sp.]|jgi:MbtH protein|nr:MbtH protein [Streptomyces sp.]